MSEESKALRLARYLREFVGLRTTTVRDVSKYDQVLWFADMPQDKGCESPAWIDGIEEGAPWLVVKKQTLPESPAPPMQIHPWIDLTACKNASNEVLPLRQTTMLPNPEKADGEDERLIQASLDDHPEVSSAYDRYIQRWEAWRNEYRRLKAIQDVYAGLFSLHTQVRKQNELVELVLGVGLLEWHAPVKNKAVTTRRHMVTAKVDLRFDAGRGEMRLEPASDGCDLRIETDMLEAELRPGQDAHASVSEQLANIGENIWDRSLIFAALEYWGRSLHADTTWSESIKPIGSPGKIPAFSFAPALILRKRTQLGMTRVYEEMIANIEAEDAEVPNGWCGLTTDEDIPSEVDGIDKGLPIENEDGSLRLPDEVYFPKPSNREQMQIVAAINRRDGVVVQGPPGTGKSHTIANLVCHLLATGKCVLITAETARALQVLKDKLPPSMRSLCVSLLGQGGDAFAELNAAVQDITTRHASFNRRNHLVRIDELEKVLDRERRSMATIDQELRKLREDEVSEYSFANVAYFGTASKIAERIGSERDSYQWLSIPSDAPEQPTLSGTSMRELLRILRAYDDTTIEDAKRQLPNSTDLPSPVELANIIQSEEKARQDVDALFELRGHPAYQAIAGLEEQRRKDLRNSIDFLGSKLRDFQAKVDGWSEHALTDCAAGKISIWQALLDRSNSLIDSIAQMAESHHDCEPCSCINL